MPYEIFELQTPYFGFSVFFLVYLNYIIKLDFKRFLYLYFKYYFKFIDYILIKASVNLINKCN